MIIAKYKIVYDNNIIQHKNLISNDDYVNIIKVKKNEIYQLENVVTKSRDLIANNKKLISEIKAELYNNFGEHYFTDNSLLFDAIKTGYIEPCFNGDVKHYCQLIKVL
jgi:hypothetical protein